MAITCRRAGVEDLPDIDNLCAQLHGAAEDVAAKLLETTLLCFVAVDEKDKQVVGFLCIDDACSTRLDSSPEVQPWLRGTAQAQGASIMSTAYVHACAVVPDYELEACSVMLHAALVAAPALERLYLATSEDITFQEPGLAAVFNRIHSSREPAAFLYEAPRDALIPPLLIRRACVEDHDDMLPLLESAEARLPALAKLPESSRPEEAFALTRVVAGQDERNSVFVAVAETSIIGFMVVTAEVETSSLADAFDLHPYDNFLPVEEYERRKEAATESVMGMKLEEKRSKLPPRKQKKSRNEEDEGDVERDEEEEEEEEEEAEQDIDMSTIAPPTEEEVRREMTHLFPGGGADEPCNIFAVTMLCIEEPFEQQAMEFMAQAFEVFPDRDYCVLTLPHSSPEPPLVRLMTRLPPLPGSIFPEVLFLFNRHALQGGLDVRLASAADAEGVSMLVAGVPDSEGTKQLLAAAQARGTAVIASCNGEVVGLITINPDVDLPHLLANFAIGKLMELPHHPPSKHAEIDMYCMNPIFAHRQREFMVGAQHLLKRSCLYYALPPGQTAPDVLGCMVQVPPRHHSIPVEKQCSFALYAFTRRLALSYKTAVNAQMLVVGASECGLSAIENLLLCPTHTFNYITLLAPGGISVGGVACEFTASIISKMGLEAAVTLLDAEMVGLDRAQQLVELSDGSQIPYDILLLTAGQQEHTRNDLAEIDPDAAGAVMNVSELASDFSFADAKTMTNISIYGDTLDAYHALAILEKRGADRLCEFSAPPGKSCPKVAILRELASRMGVSIPEPQIKTLEKLESVEGELRPKAFFQVADPSSGEVSEESSNIDLMVGTRGHDISKTIFYCLNDSGIVYDGHVVVDASFRTNDSNIYAAGSVAKLSRRCGSKVQYEHYNSAEVGQRLAESVVEALSTSSPASTADVQLAPLFRAKSVGCNVPGGMLFLMTGTPAAMMKPALEPPEGGEALLTSTSRGTFQMNLDASSRVHSILFLGLHSPQVTKMSSLVGLHASYFNNLVAKYQGEQVEDLLGYFEETWAQFLFHDHFPGFRSTLLSTGGQSADDELLNMEGLVGGAQDAMLNFIRAHMEELAYLLPQTA